MRRAWPIGLAAVLVPFLLACPAEPPVAEGPRDFPPPVDGGQPGPQNPNKAPTCPDIEFTDPNQRCFILQTFVESRFGPYDVYLSITGGKYDGGVYPPHIPVAAGGWKHSVSYPAKNKLTISLHFELEKAGSKDGYCSITDGNNPPVIDHVHSSSPGGGPPYIAACQTTTAQ